MGVGRSGCGGADVVSLTTPSDDVIGECASSAVSGE